MAGELNVIYNATGASLYALLRQRTTGYVWNGTALVVWNNANIGAYDIPLTDQGGDYYSANMPATIGAGDYVIVYCVQAGASPAITDQDFKTETKHWNGAALVDTSVVTLSAYALTTVVKVKRYMGLSVDTYDDLLTELINAWTDRMERMSDAQFAARDHTDRVNGSGTRTLVLPYCPVNSIASLGLVTGAGTEEATEALTAQDYRYDSATGIVSLETALWASGNLRTFVRGFRNVVAVYNAGFATIPDDLDMLCRELVKEAFDRTRKDGAVKSESLADYSYTLADSITLTDLQSDRMRRWVGLALGNTT